ncbi:unnamed protein product [Musa hybrid cultivar]
MTLRRRMGRHSAAAAGVRSPATLGSHTLTAAAALAPSAADTTTAGEARLSAATGAWARNDLSSSPRSRSMSEIRPSERSNPRPSPSHVLTTTPPNARSKPPSRPWSSQ